MSKMTKVLGKNDAYGCFVQGMWLELFLLPMPTIIKKVVKQFSKRENSNLT